MAQIKHLLAPIALDFLSVPGKNLIFSCYNDSDHHTLLATSTDVERTFSCGGLTVSKMCHSLSDESTRAATVLSSWCDSHQQSLVMKSFQLSGTRARGLKVKKYLRLKLLPVM